VGFYWFPLTPYAFKMGIMMRLVPEGYSYWSSQSCSTGAVTARSLKPTTAFKASFFQACIRIVL